MDISNSKFWKDLYQSIKDKDNTVKRKPYTQQCGRGGRIETNTFKESNVVEQSLNTINRLRRELQDKGMRIHALEKELHDSQKHNMQLRHELSTVSLKYFTGEFIKPKEPFTPTVNIALEAVKNCLEVLRIKKENKSLNETVKSQKKSLKESRKTIANLRDKMREQSIAMEKSISINETLAGVAYDKVNLTIDMSYVKELVRHSEHTVLGAGDYMTFRLNRYPDFK